MKKTLSALSALLVASHANAGCIESVTMTDDYLKFRPGASIARADGAMMKDGHYEFYGTTQDNIPGIKSQGFAGYKSTSATGTDEYRFMGAAPGYSKLTIPNNPDEPEEEYGLETVSLIKVNNIYMAAAMGHVYSTAYTKVSAIRFLLSYGAGNSWYTYTPEYDNIPDWAQLIVSKKTNRPWGGMEEPSLLFYNDSFIAYFAAQGLENGAVDRRFGVMTSTDGVYWTIRQEPVMRPSDVGYWNGSKVVNTNMPDVSIVGNTFIMAFSGMTDDELRICKQQISAGLNVYCPSHVGLATSKDGISWTMYENNPAASPRLQNALGTAESFTRGPFFARNPHGDLALSDDTGQLFYWTQDGAVSWEAKIKFNLGECE